MADLARIDTEEAAEYTKDHTPDLLKNIREHLSPVSLEAAVLPEDDAQKHLLAVSNNLFILN